MEAHFWPQTCNSHNSDKHFQLRGINKFVNQAAKLKFFPKYEWHWKTYRLQKRSSEYRKAEEGEKGGKEKKTKGETIP